VVGIFPPYMVNTVKIGEQAGTVDSVMESMAVYYAREAKIRYAIKNAITYPVVLVAMMALVIGVLVVEVLPIFTQVFRNLGTDMSASSVAIMNFGLAAGRTVLIIVVALIVLGGGLFFLSKTKKKEAVTKFIGKVFPPIRELTKKTAATRFASVMAMMLNSGFPIDSALSLIPDVLNDEGAKKKVAICKKRMTEDGVSFPEAIEECAIFDGIHSRMIRVGFMAGQLDSVMDKLAEIYNEDIDNNISRMVSLIEPSLVGILSVIIGAVLLAVMLPLASIMSSM